MGEFDELLVLEVRGQSSRGKLVNMGFPVAGTDDSNAIQTLRPPGGR